MKFLPSLIIVAIFLVPEFASAANFVTCSGETCSACNFVQMANKIITWLIGMMFVIFAIIAVVAGFGLVTSGGNPAAITAAKSKFTNAFIGLVIVLAAFLVVDTLMRKLLSGGTGTISGYGPWSEIECGTQTAMTAVNQDNASEAVTAPTDVTCTDIPGLIAKYGGSPVGVDSPDILTLKACYLADPAINAGIDHSKIFTVDEDHPICAATNGNPVCGACSHSIRSCHYGRGHGQGAMGIDFNASGISEAQLYDLLKIRQQTCGGRLNFETNHTHISTNSC